MSQVYRLPAETQPSCPAGTKLVIIPQAVGEGVRLLVPARVSSVVVILDDDGSLGWIEDSVTGRGILDYVQAEPEE